MDGWIYNTLPSVVFIGVVFLILKNYRILQDYYAVVEREGEEREGEEEQNTLTFFRWW